MPIDKERQPVIVGVGRYTQRKKKLEEAFTPIGLTAYASEKAAIDTGVKDPKKLLSDVVAIGTVGMFLETRWLAVFGEKPYSNFSKSVANKIGANPKVLWRR